MRPATTWLKRSIPTRGTHGTTTATRCCRLRRRRRPMRRRALPTAATPHGTTWTQTGAGITYRGKAMCGRRMRHPARDGILTGAVTGCGRQGMATSGCRATLGAICRSSAEIGITMTALAGDGCRGWEAAHPGGTAVTLAPTSAAAMADTGPRSRPIFGLALLLDAEATSGRCLFWL